MKMGGRDRGTKEITVGENMVSIYDDGSKLVLKCKNMLLKRSLCIAEIIVFVLDK